MEKHIIGRQGGEEVVYPAHFLQTQWTLVLKARERDDSKETEAALNELCSAYWYPLYAFARKLGRSPHDCQDLTQGFFAYLLKEDLLASADPALGKLRTFLLTIFTRYITRERVHANAQKRGGGRKIESLDEEFTDGERRYRLEPADLVTPEQIFDRSWALSLLEGARRRLEKSEEDAGRGKICKALGPFLDFSRDPQVTYETASADLKLSQEAVRKAVSRLRERYREAVREKIADTLSHPTEQDVENEVRALWVALG